jgi:hypothetical protein
MTLDVGLGQRLKQPSANGSDRPSQAAKLRASHDHKALDRRPGR